MEYQAKPGSSNVWQGIYKVTHVLEKGKKKIVRNRRISAFGSTNGTGINRLATPYFEILLLMKNKKKKAYDYWIKGMDGTGKL